VNGIGVIGTVRMSVSCNVAVVIVAAIITADNDIGICEVLWWIPSSVTGDEGSSLIAG